MLVRLIRSNFYFKTREDRKFYRKLALFKSEGVFYIWFSGTIITVDPDNIGGLVDRLLRKSLGDWPDHKPKMGDLDINDVLLAALNSRRLVVVPGANYNISTLQPKKRGLHCDAMEEAFPDIDWQEMQRASDKGPDLQKAKLLKMATQTGPSLLEQDLTPETLLDLMWIIAADTTETDGEGNVLRHTPVDFEDLADVPVHDTSPGYQDHNFHKDEGDSSKRVQVLETVLQLAAHESAKTPLLCVDKPCPKAEVTEGPGKDGKLKAKVSATSRLLTQRTLWPAMRAGSVPS